MASKRDEADTRGLLTRVTDIYIDGDSDTEVYLCSSSKQGSDSDVVVSSSSDEDDDEASNRAIAGAHQWTQIDSKNIPPNAPRFPFLECPGRKF